MAYLLAVPVALVVLYSVRMSRGQRPTVPIRAALALGLEATVSYFYPSLTLALLMLFACQVSKLAWHE